jgi:hypothetical protein
VHSDYKWEKNLNNETFVYYLFFKRFELIQLMTSYVAQQSSYIFMKPILLRQFYENKDGII